MLGEDCFQKSLKGMLSSLAILNRLKSDDEVVKMYKIFVDCEGFCDEKELF